MLKELVEYLYGLGQSSERAVDAKIDDPRRKAFLLGKDAFYLDVPAPLRKCTVTTLSDFAAACTEFGSKGSVWHDEKKVVLVMDNDDRRETVTLPLTFSRHWQIVSGLGEYLTQQAFVKLLRHDLAGVVPDSLRPAISKIEIATSSGVKSEINPGRERGSREFAADLANSGEIPEVIHAALSVYATNGLRQKRTVKLSLDYTLPPKEIAFSVKPLPDELEIAMQDAQAELHHELEALVTIPVFSGTP